MPGNMQIRLKLDTAKLDELERTVPGRADKIVGEIAFGLQGYIQTHFTVSPSSPGEAPGIDTGMLKNSIHSERVKDRVWRVSDGVEYGIMLEFGTRNMAARPFFTPAIEVISRKLTAYFKDLLK